MSFVITAVGHTKLTSAHVEQIQTVLKTLPVKMQTFAMTARDKAIEFLVDIDLTHFESPSDATLDEAVLSISADLRAAAAATNGFDLNFQRNDPLRREKKLVVFDMDSTLIQQEVIELIAARAGVEAQVEEITTRAMNGELDFKQSLAERVLLLKGIPSQTLWDDLKPKIKLTNGALELCQFLKSKGTKLAVCSGGFLPLAQYVQKQLGLDYAFANVLETEVVDGVEVLSGRTIGDVVDGTRKRELLLQLAQENSVELAQTVAVGDGANDLLMMAAAGSGVAWHAKPVVQKQAPTVVNSESLADALYVFGYGDADLAAAGSSA